MALPYAEWQILKNIVLSPHLLCQLFVKKTYDCEFHYIAVAANIELNLYAASENYLLQSRQG
jgi:hypothetical protein